MLPGAARRDQQGHGRRRSATTMATNDSDPGLRDSGTPGLHPPSDIRLIDETGLCERGRPGLLTDAEGGQAWWGPGSSTRLILVA